MWVNKKKMLTSLFILLFFALVKSIFVTCQRVFKILYRPLGGRTSCPCRYKHERHVYVRVEDQSSSHGKNRTNYSVERMNEIVP